MEFENIVGEPLREAERLEVPTPNLRMVYGLLKILQTNIKEEKGLVSFPTGPDPTRPILAMVHGSPVPT
jgi:Ketopantoate reductase PanE/ApbA C terminal